MAEHLDTAGVGTWRESGAYQSGEIGIYDRAIPQTPDTIITLAVYPIGSNLPGLADHMTAVQVRLRGTADSRVCDDLADAIFTELDGLRRVTWGDIPIVEVWRQSYTPLGQDANKRWERSENYYLHAMRPTSNNTD